MNLRAQCGTPSSLPPSCRCLGSWWRRCSRRGRIRRRNMGKYCRGKVRPWAWQIKLSAVRSSCLQGQFSLVKTADLKTGSHCIQGVWWYNLSTIQLLTLSVLMYPPTTTLLRTRNCFGKKFKNYELFTTFRGRCNHDIAVKSYHDHKNTQRRYQLSCQYIHPQKHFLIGSILLVKRCVFACIL